MSLSTPATSSNGALEPEVRAPGREPSPLPTHLSIPNGAHSTRVIHDQSTGYVAPKFEGKERQMEQGEWHTMDPMLLAGQVLQVAKVVVKFRP